MADVYNWQLGRDMFYLYEHKRPKRQFAAVFDLNKCISCQTCTLACKTIWTSGKGQEQVFWNNVETKPYGSYPLGWDVNILSKLGLQTWENGIYKGKTIYEAAPEGERVLGYNPPNEDWIHPNLGEDEVIGIIEKGAYLKIPHTLSWMFYLPRICNHCSFTACVVACPRKAIYKRPEDGITLIDQTRCRGYRECVRACPYKKVVFNAFTRVSEKCIGCFPFIEKGFQNQCFINCIGKIRIYGFINLPDKAREDNPVDFLVHIKKVALPLYPQLGLEPNVYYIPPIHVPTNFLIQMFHPRVEEAIKIYNNIKEDKNLLGLLALLGSTNRIISSFKVTEDQAIGSDEKGQEIIRVPLKEPIYERPFFDEKLGVYRHNIT